MAASVLAALCPISVRLKFCTVVVNDVYFFSSKLFEKNSLAASEFTITSTGLRMVSKAVLVVVESV